MVLEGINKGEYYTHFNVDTKKWQTGKSKRLKTDAIIQTISSRIEGNISPNELREHSTVLTNIIQRLDHKKLSHIWHCIPIIGTIIRAIWNRNIDARLNELHSVENRLPSQILLELQQHQRELEQQAIAIHARINNIDPASITADMKNFNAAIQEIQRLSAAIQEFRQAGGATIQEMILDLPAKKIELRCAVREHFHELATELASLHRIHHIDGDKPEDPPCYEWNQLEKGPSRKNAGIGLSKQVCDRITEEIIHCIEEEEALPQEILEKIEIVEGINIQPSDEQLISYSDLNKEAYMKFVSLKLMEIVQTDSHLLPETKRKMLEALAKPVGVPPGEKEYDGPHQHDRLIYRSFRQRAINVCRLCKEAASIGYNHSNQGQEIVSDLAQLCWRFRRPGEERLIEGETLYGVRASIYSHHQLHASYDNRGTWQAVAE